MPEITAQQLENLATTCLNYYIKGKAQAQDRQKKPLLDKLRARQKSFPGGNNKIAKNIKGDPDATYGFVGYSHDDEVTYGDPTKIRQPQYQWYEHHIGLKVTHTQLKQIGITVVDSTTGERTSSLSGADEMRISNLFEEQLDDMRQAAENSLDRLLHLDGTQAAKVTPGIAAYVSVTPTVGVTGGIDRSIVTYFRNRALVGASKITSSPTNQTLINTLQDEVIQLSRYNAMPDLWIAGSTALRLLQREVRANGQYSQSGFNKEMSVSIGGIAYEGIGVCQYDPTLDNLGLDDFMYLLDTKNIRLYGMENEDMRAHAPARPPETYALYRAITWTGTLCAWQLNSSGVYQVA